MIKLFIILILLIPSICLAEASGYLFLGHYFGNELLDKEGRTIKYNAGIYLEIDSKWATLFMRDETFISDIDLFSANPKQINYAIGVKRRFENIEIKLMHECLHPVDGRGNGRQAISYNLIEGRYNF